MTAYLLEDESEHRRGSGWGKLVVALVVIGVLSGGLWWWMENRASDQVLSDDETVLIAPTAESAPPPSPARTTVPAPARAVASTPATDAALVALLQEAQVAQRDNHLLVAREKALEAHRRAPANSPLQRRAEEILNVVNIDLVMTPRDMPEKVDYTVRPGDSLERIARQHNTTIELVRKSNNVRGSLIRAGDRMRIFTGDFAIYVSKSANDLVLTMNGDFFKRYRVGTGEFGRTPVGEFVVNSRIAEPTWWRPDGRAIPYGDEENLLGTHWLGFNLRGYGIHGTWEPETIGHQLSAGCVRMLNEEVEELFTLITEGTPVIITE
jgi:lipoprotein-anchoring transpeptidase ErfK/SrfK